MRALEEFLPVDEVREKHSLAISAPPERVDSAVRRVTLAEIPVARALFALRSVGRGSGLAKRPLMETMLENGVLLEDVPGEGLVVGLAGQFWKLRGGLAVDRPHTCEEFRSYGRGDVARAVMDVRVHPAGAAGAVLTTETRIHVPDPTARKKLLRYWSIVRPFSGLTRILLLRAARARAEAPA